MSTQNKNEQYVITLDAIGDMIKTMESCRNCCREALTNEWDRSDDGFKSMIQDIDQVFDSMLTAPPMTPDA